MSLKGDTYEERSRHQLEEWVKGNPICNEMDNECCPDFSCCRPELLKPEEWRKVFYASHLKEQELKKIPTLYHVNERGKWLCSGYKVHPDGVECSGCSDCTKKEGYRYFPEENSTTGMLMESLGDAMSTALGDKTKDIHIGGGDPHVERKKNEN